MSAFDGAFDALAQYNVLVGTVIFNPAHLIDAPRPEQSTPYHVLPIRNRTTAQVYYSAPTYAFKNNMLYPVKAIVPGQYGVAVGQAPTSGIYTGIPSGCSAGGLHGGNPYS